MELEKSEIVEFFQLYFEREIFLQIWDAETEPVGACFDPELLDSDEEAPIEPSDGQSVVPLKYTIEIYHAESRAGGKMCGIVCAYM